MASIDLHVHAQSSFVFAPLEQLVGVLDVTDKEAEAANGGEPTTVKGLAFIDNDGEGHVYVLTENGRQKLIAQLTGGVVIP